MKGRLDAKLHFARKYVGKEYFALLLEHYTMVSLANYHGHMTLSDINLIQTLDISSSLTFKI